MRHYMSQCAPISTTKETTKQPLNKTTNGASRETLKLASWALSRAAAPLQLHTHKRLAFETRSGPMAATRAEANLLRHAVAPLLPRAKPANLWRHAEAPLLARAEAPNLGDTQHPRCARTHRAKLWRREQAHC